MSEPDTTEFPDRIDLARDVARILGPSSGAARAVARYDQLRAAGQSTKIVRTKTMWLVEEPFEPATGIASMGAAFKREIDE